MINHTKFALTVATVFHMYIHLKYLGILLEHQSEVGIASGTHDTVEPTRTMYMYVEIVMC